MLKKIPYMIPLRYWWGQINHHGMNPSSGLKEITIKFPKARGKIASLALSEYARTKSHIYFRMPFWNEKIKESIKSNHLDDDSIFAYATFNGLLGKEPWKFAKENSELFHDTICRLCEEGWFLLALLLASRTPEIDAVSILQQCELTQDGFNNTGQRIFGNYLHRRILNYEDAVTNKIVQNFCPT